MRARTGVCSFWLFFFQHCALAQCHTNKLDCSWLCQAALFPQPNLCRCHTTKFLSMSKSFGLPPNPPSQTPPSPTETGHVLSKPELRCRSTVLGPEIRFRLTTGRGTILIREGLNQALVQYQYRFFVWELCLFGHRVGRASARVSCWVLLPLWQCLL